MVSRRALLACAAALAAGLVSLVDQEAHAACQKTRLITVYDSHGLTSYGDFLDGWALSQPGAELQSYTLGGANPEWLLKLSTSPRGHRFDSCAGVPRTPRAQFKKRSLRAPMLDELLRVPPGTYDKQVVILSLGGNVPGFPQVHTPRVEKLVRIVNAHPEAVCIWVGPPSMRVWADAYAERVYEAIRAGIRAAEQGSSRPGPACHLIDSRRYTQYPKRGGDGWHYGFFPEGIAGAKGWATGVAAEIEHILAAPPAVAKPP